MNGTGPAGGDSERQPLLAVHAGDREDRPSTFRSYLARPLSRRRADLVLLLCYLVTGLLDSTSIAAWGSFVSMQTGNTVYIGLGLAAPTESTRWLKSLTSLGSFCAGSFLFSRFQRSFGNAPTRRAILLASFALQAALIVGAACVVTFAPNPRQPPPKLVTADEATNELSWPVLLPIALLSLQACGQAAASRALAYPSLTSVVLTSIYCDLWGDARLFAGVADNIERNRRVAAAALLACGAVLGGVFGHMEGNGMAVALWTAAVLKGLAVLAWALWPGEDEER